MSKIFTVSHKAGSLSEWPACLILDETVDNVAGFFSNNTTGEQRSCCFAVIDSVSATRCRLRYNIFSVSVGLMYGLAGLEFHQIIRESNVFPK